MNVRETVESSLGKQGVPLSPQYRRYADGVITDLEEREREIVSNLLAFATDKGLSREEAINALDDCGLDVRAESDEADTPTTSEDPRIAAMERAMEEMQATLRELREG